MPDDISEIEACRRLAPKCFFIFGYARSSTTLTQHLMNTHPRAYITGEAHYFHPRPADNFTASYNQQHIGFGNQINKSSYAPDFLPGAPHGWLAWLEQAALRYDLVGDKIAFSPFFLPSDRLAEVRLFYERRFFESRYFFLHRDPIQSMLSAIATFKLETQASVGAHINAWLDYVQLWADMVRYFPHTRTCLSEQMDTIEATAMGKFAGLDLPGSASRQINQERRHLRTLPPEQTLLSAMEPALIEVHTAIRNACRTCDPEGAIERPAAFNAAWFKAKTLKTKLADMVAAHS